MTDISFLNFFGTAGDFENLKKWFRINSELYREVIIATKERCDLEAEYSSRLSKINSKLLKSFGQSIGCVSILWSKTAHLMNEESDAHKNLGNQIYEEFYKPLVSTSDQFNKFKRPIEVDVDKCIKLYQEKKEEELRLKKKAFLATKESEKAYDSIAEYKASHPSSISGNDKERSKIEKRAEQFRDLSTKAEAEYFQSSLDSEESRNRWEQSYVSSLEQLQNLETERQTSMKSILESYQKCINKIPATYGEISNRLLKEISLVSIRDDLFENCMNFTNKSPNVYKTEQLMLDFYAESKENVMDNNRRKENLMKRISVLYQFQKKNDNLRTGALKLLTVYDATPQFADESTRKKTKREFSKTQCLSNLLSANIYKIQKALNTFDNKPLPVDPLCSLGMKIIVCNDKNVLTQSVLESKYGTILPCYEPCISRSSSNSGSWTKDMNTYDDEEYFHTDSDSEEPPTKPHIVPQKSLPITQVPSKNRPLSQVVPTKNTTMSRPLPSLPTTVRCKALHAFKGRDGEELSFIEGDIIYVRNKLSDVWWEGELKGKVGLIPVNYVKELL